MSYPRLLQSATNWTTVCTIVVWLKMESVFMLCSLKSLSFSVSQSQTHANFVDIFFVNMYIVNTMFSLFNSNRSQRLTTFFYSCCDGFSLYMYHIKSMCHKIGSYSFYELTNEKHERRRERKRENWNNRCLP